MNDSAPTLKVLIVSLLLVGLSACATTDRWSATGGNRQAGVVRLSYDYPEFHQPQMNDAEAERLALNRCNAWGYQQAEPIEGQIRQCSNMQLVFFASTVNGIFEELFVVGYIITALREVRGVWTAINASTVLRLLYHLYQGPIGVITIVPMGLLYGYVYARTRQLWPLIFAHVLIDIVGLSALGRLIENT